jgi:sugar/nucleoside kinase (ribokinase family)
MNTHPADIVVAGHTCIDIIPTFDPSQFPGGSAKARLDMLLVPGKLVNVGATVLSTGGAVSNTGLALHRLGIPVRLVGKVGSDLFGQAILQAFRNSGEHLAEGMVIAPGDASSYTVVINPPGVDRVFLHCPGANDSFCAADITLEHLAGARIFHFGYPPLMKRMYADGGMELSRLLGKVKQAGLVVSLDMARPDPDSPAGKVDWASLLVKVLPLVDFCVPSLDETLFMLDRPRFDRLMAEMRGTHEPLPGVDGALLGEMSQRLIEMGAAVVMLKLGDQGLYVRTSADPQRIEGLCQHLGLPAGSWTGREVLSPCFKAKLVGTTGAGDATIAGFLASANASLPFEGAVSSGVAVGACSVEAADASSAIPTWQAVQHRIQAGWEQLPLSLSLPGWRSSGGLFIGPHDQNNT